MSRVKISEYRAKNIINDALGQNQFLLSIDTGVYDEKTLRKQLSTDMSYVVKVDQAVKRRNVLNLVALDLSVERVIEEVTRLKELGYTWVFIEEFKKHDTTTEKYLALERTENGITMIYSDHGGVAIEDNADSLKFIAVQADLSLPREQSFEAIRSSLEKIIFVFEKSHMTYLEVNPFYLDQDGQLVILDAAIEVDSSAEFFVEKLWSASDIRNPKKDLNEQERIVDELAATSPSSLNLKVLNPNGEIFLLLSGGGASVVVADELSNLGCHEEMANYGEYSGNPTEEETYLYTQQVLDLLVKSKATNKVLIIAGGVANFTDVAKTFKGIIRAIDEVAAELRSQGVAVFVRRGGPNQTAGLEEMRTFLSKSELENSVNGPDVSLAGVVKLSVERLKK